MFELGASACAGLICDWRFQHASFLQMTWLRGCSPGAHGRWTTRSLNPVGGAYVYVSASARTAGAVDSVTWNNKEFINNYDHGRQYQVAGIITLIYDANMTSSVSVFLVCLTLFSTFVCPTSCHSATSAVFCSWRGLCRRTVNATTPQRLAVARMERVTAPPAYWRTFPLLAMCCTPK